MTGGSMDRTVGELHGRLQGLESAVGDLRREITLDISDVRTEMRQTVVEVRHEMIALRRLVWGVMLAAVLGPVTAALITLAGTSGHVP